MNCNTNPNRHIECSVTQCKHHCCDVNYCSLDKISIGTHEAEPTRKQCTDCLSFDCK